MKITSHHLFSIGLASLACIFSNRECGPMNAGEGMQLTQCHQNIQHMKMNAGIITPHIAASRDFYTGILGFQVIYEADWFVLLATPDGGQQLSFLQPGHPSQQPLFQPEFGGKGVYLTIEVEDVDSEYRRIRELGVPVSIELRDEPWGDRHFAITDPNGVGVDIVKYTAPGS